MGAGMALVRGKDLELVHHLVGGTYRCSSDVLHSETRRIMFSQNGIHMRECPEKKLSRPERRPHIARQGRRAVAYKVRACTNVGSLRADNSTSATYDARSRATSSSGTAINS
ncbi:hypothetical protein KEM60_03184 [Austwickia sp. TVS 96-490-7B]|nr:hypothetical protein [Austwickia sp. TVS 96-490-7B]